MARLEKELAEAFVCARCDHRGADVQRLAMTGTGISRVFDVQQYRYAFASCSHCGYTEVFNLKVLEGIDHLETFLDTLFAR